MIPLPSLLFLDSDLSIGEGGDANDSCPKCSDSISKDGSSNSPLEANNSIESDRNKIPKRKRYQRHRVRPPPSPLRLRHIPKADPPRYRDLAVAGRAPFWERQQREEEQNRCPRNHPVASIRRHSQLFAFVITLASYVAVDDYTLLPAGTLLYVLALTLAYENWTNECEENLRYLEKLRQYHQNLKTIEREVEKARFEYHVLRNQPHVDIVALRKTRTKANHHPRGDSRSNILDMDPDFDPEHDHWIIYADEKKRRPRPQQAVRPQPPHGPRYWRSTSEQHSNRQDFRKFPFP